MLWRRRTRAGLNEPCAEPPSRASARRSGGRSGATRLDAGERTRMLFGLTMPSAPQHLVVGGSLESSRSSSSSTRSLRIDPLRGGEGAGAGGGVRLGPRRLVGFAIRVAGARSARLRRSADVAHRRAAVRLGACDAAWSSSSVPSSQRLGWRAARRAVVPLRT